MSEQPEAITLEASQYWKFRAINADVQNLELQVRQAMDKAAATRNAVCVEVGLDPATNYSCDDATLSVTVVPR